MAKATETLKKAKDIEVYDWPEEVADLLVLTVDHARECAKGFAAAQNSTLWVPLDFTGTKNGHPKQVGAIIFTCNCHHWLCFSFSDCTWLLCGGGKPKVKAAVGFTRNAGTSLIGEKGAAFFL